MKALLTVKEVAERLAVSVSQVYALVQAGKLRAYRLTTKEQGGLRFSETQIEDFLANAETGGFEGEQLEFLK